MKTVSRRTVLKASALGTAGIGLSNVDCRGWPRGAHHVPALVVGSGFGGAVAALRLAQAGIRTLVLERGRRWPITEAGDTFATFENPDGRAAWLSPVSPVALIEQQFGIAPTPIDVFAGVLEGIQGNGINVVAGAGVGGGSLVYNAITLEPRRELFERVFGNLVSFEEMNSTYFPRVRSVIQPAAIPDDILATDFFASTRLNLERAMRAGLATRPLELAVDWDIVRLEMRGERSASAIAGQSWYGLNSGAKKSLDHNYLAQAEQTGYAEILPLHVVTSIGEAPGADFYFVEALEIDETGAPIAQRRFTCRHLFLAAGSVGTTRLLVKARATGNLPRLPDQVGQHWGTNGDFVVVRAGAAPTNPGTGGPAGHFLAEDFDNPNDPIGLVELVTPRHLALSPGISCYVGMGMPPAVGKFEYDVAKGEVMLTWPDAADPRLASFLSAADRTIEKLDLAATTQTLLNATTLSAHPLGGATIGTVCDAYGRIKDHRGLYVVDGAFIPGSTGIVNPSLTIAALAERSLERILANEF